MQELGKNVKNNHVAVAYRGAGGAFGCNTKETTGLRRNRQPSAAANKTCRRQEVSNLWNSMAGNAYCGALRETIATMSQTIVM